MNSTNFNSALDKFVDHYNCNQIEANVFKCFEELDKKIFFKTRKYKKCLKLQNDFQHCLVYSNENKFTKREVINPRINAEEVFDKYRDRKVENKKDAFDYVSGKVGEEAILNKDNKDKNLIEF